MRQPSQRRLTVIERVWRVMQGRNIQSMVAATMHLLCLAYKERDTLQTRYPLVNVETFRIITLNPHRDKIIQLSDILALSVPDEGYSRKDLVTKYIKCCP